MFLLFAVVLISLGYCLLKQHYRYWKKRGVPGPSPRLLVGNVGESFIFRKSVGEIVTDIYRQYEDASVVGIFKASTPILLIRDPEVVKDVTVKDFKYFEDNDIDIDKDVDPLFGRHPFCLKGDAWRKSRSQVSPCFTSGKMKSLYPLIEDSCQKFVKYLEDRLKRSEPLEAKDLCTDYTLNNVASCAFGLDGKCLEDPNNDFKRLATRFFSPASFESFKIFLALLIPALPKLVKIKFTPSDVEEKLTDLVSETLRYRRENNVVRNDFLDILVQLQSSPQGPKLSTVEITAHAAGFLGDGYETSSIVMSFLLYELAANPEAQRTLREEVAGAFEANGGKLSYEDVMGMQYLDAVLNESQRMHPAIFYLSKACTSTYKYTPRQGDGISKPSVEIEKGTPIILPLLALQNDPKYFKDPERFIPERFLGKNKETIVKYTFLPFGEGPRACLGQRFGILQVKAAVAYIVKNFAMNVSSKTKVPLKYDPVYLLAAPVGGLWINFKKL